MENTDFTGPSSGLVLVKEQIFGRRVRSIRKERGLSQKALADALSLTGRTFHQTTIAKIEAGTRPTSVGEIELLAVVLDVEAADFFDPAEPGGLGELAQLRDELKEAQANVDAVWRRIDAYLDARARNSERAYPRDED
ncbi:helix-turn-helix domain-containing protein [Pseudoclavibacter helvolus]|uniref:helix-turn-helix domain-containing protein n=1 Tax=Pseudoclavibacter helvolus TaxID=255205 RepID=UPI0024AE3640|nr:helix-turn-helix transcriptional regulator [Pseudoclavibacter helvolus]